MTKPHIKFKIVTPERIVFEDTVDAVVVPTVDGEITILPHHIPLVTLLKAGVLQIKKGDEMTPLAVSNGVMEVDGRHVVILADTAERADELEEEKIQHAKEEAEKLMNARRGDEVGFADAAAGLEREIVRLKVAQKYRHKSRGPTPRNEE